MSSEYASQVTVGLLLLILLSVLTIGMLFTLAAIRYLEARRSITRRRDHTGLESDLGLATGYVAPLFDNPSRWLVIRSSSPETVQGVLGLHNAKPCSWGEGLSRLSDHTLFISPPIDGWLLVVGPGLPDPAEDVDECFRFVTKLSRELGLVQFFSVNRAVGHHAWAKAESGQIIRAYAWAGETLWNQGSMTSLERQLGIRCYDYGETPEIGLSAHEFPHTNTEKILFLAARWSFDPANLDTRRLSAAQGITGDLIHLG